MVAGVIFSIEAWKVLVCFFYLITRQIVIQSQLFDNETISNLSLTRVVIPINFSVSFQFCFIRDLNFFFWVKLFYVFLSRKISEVVGFVVKVKECGHLKGSHRCQTYFRSLSMTIVFYDRKDWRDIQMTMQGDEALWEGKTLTSDCFESIKFYGIEN